MHRQMRERLLTSILVAAVFAVTPAIAASDRATESEALVRPASPVLPRTTAHPAAETAGSSVLVWDTITTPIPRPTPIADKDVLLEGRLHYEYFHTGPVGLVRMTVDSVMNYRLPPTLSGNLRLELWATVEPPVMDRPVYPYSMCAYDLGPLEGGKGRRNVDTGYIVFTTPPPGTYSISAALLEDWNGAYHYVDFVTFPTRRAFGTDPSFCQDTDSAFCAQTGRFEVSLRARDHRTDKTDDGFVMLRTNVYGMFAFPVIASNTTDPQILVKVLDGRPVNGHWWVFIATLTDVEFEVTVHDTITGAVREYRSEAGSTSSMFDVNAF